MSKAIQNHLFISLVLVTIVNNNNNNLKNAK